MIRFLRALAFLPLLLLAVPALAQEEILSFTSDVTVETDGDLLVVETIRVRSEGIDIRRGIYRDFPVTFRSDSGTGRNSFELISATRDGQPENYRIESGGTFVRVWLGRENVFLDRAVHTYVLTYRTDRQLRFFDDHDEVYWNATGTEWLFPILEATAIIRLPAGAQATDAKAFTGAFGSTAQDATFAFSPDRNVVTFRTTGELGSRQGLTVVVAFPKGVIAAPTQAQRLAWYWRDNSGTLVALIGLALVVAYYLFAWNRVGRDPPGGVVVPRWDMPDGVSPALTHYIWNRGLKRQGFPAISAAALSLAVKGHVELDEIGDSITMKATDKPWVNAGLPSGEKAVMGEIAVNNGTLAISRANGGKIVKLGTAFRQAMEREHRSVFYRHNVGWIIGGVALSAAVIIATILFGGSNSPALVLIFPLAIVGIFVTSIVVNFAKSAGDGLGGKLKLIFLGFVMLAFFMNGGIWFAWSMFSVIGDTVLVSAVVTLIMVNVLFFFLMGAPTPLGRKRADEIEGLKRYLTVAEADRMNMAGAPQMSPQHYETLLPFAVALGVEKQWSNAFQTWLAAAVAAGAAAAAAYYGPKWYHGKRPFDSNTVGSTMGGLASSMSKSFTASLPAPKSSSSGFSSGGGSSGGGGGGGGGGGW